MLFTAFILAMYRLGSWVPAPGVDSAAIEDYFGGQGGNVLGLLNLFSGSALSRFSLFALGIMPYVTASIILQLLTVVIPKLEALQKEGEAGYAKINQYTRYFTVVLAAAQALGYAYLFKRQDALNIDTGRLVLIVITLTAGTTLLMWMGELITKRGIGNGISLLIFASILTSAPGRRSTPGSTAGRWRSSSSRSSRSAIVVAVVFMQEGQRRIPIQYAKRMVGRRQTAGGSTYMPLRVNMAGVIPVIFAAADHGVPADDRPVLPADAGLHQRALLALELGVPAARRRADRRSSPTSTRRSSSIPVDQADNLRKYQRLHPGHPPRPADRAVPRPRAHPADAPRRALPGGRSRSCRRSSSATAASRRRPRALSAARRS